MFQEIQTVYLSVDAEIRSRWSSYKIGFNNCRDISNTQQTDFKRNGIGDACQQSEVRIGKIWGDIKYVDGRGRVRPFDSLRLQLS